MGMKNRGMGVMSSRCGEHGMNIVMRKEVSQVRGVVDDGGYKGMANSYIEEIIFQSY